MPRASGSPRSRSSSLGRIQDVAERCYGEAMHEAAKFFFNSSRCACGAPRPASGGRWRGMQSRLDAHVEGNQGEPHRAQGVPADAALRAPLHITSSTPTSTASSTRTGRRRRQLQFRLVDCRHYHSRLSDHHHHHHHPRYRCNHPRPRPRPRHRRPRCGRRPRPARRGRRRRPQRNST